MEQQQQTPKPRKGKRSYVTRDRKVKPELRSYKNAIHILEFNSEAIREFRLFAYSFIGVDSESATEGRFTLSMSVRSFRGSVRLKKRQWKTALYFACPWLTRQQGIRKEEFRAYSLTLLKDGLLQADLKTINNENT